jgi:hypothetical protein
MIQPEIAVALTALCLEIPFVLSRAPWIREGCQLIQHDSVDGNRCKWELDYTGAS